MALWIIFTPVIIFLNSFFSGKLYKRINRYLNSYQTFLFGFLTFFGIFSLILITLFLFNINFEIILYIALIYQIIFIIIYALNWRNFFITYKLNWKLLILFFCFLLISVIVFFITIKYTNEIKWFLNSDLKFVDYYNDKFLNKPINSINIFEFNKNHYQNNMSYLYVNIFIYIFQIKGSEIIYFFKYFNFLVIFITVATMFMNIYCQRKITHRNIFFIITFYFIVNLISYWLNQFAYVIIFSLLIVFLHANKQNQIKTNMLIILINLCVLLGCSFDINFLLCAVIINLVQIFISYIQVKENATEYNILMFFSTLLLIASIFNNENYLSFILILIIFGLYIIFFFYKSSSLSKKINVYVDNFLYKKIYIILLFFILAIWIVALILLFNVTGITVDVKPWFINTKQGYTSLTKINYYLTNIFFWVTNCIILVYSLIKNDFWWFRSKKEKLYFQNDLTLILILVFWNPISINFFNIINNSSIVYVPFNLQAIFFSVLVPIILNKLKNITSLVKINKIDYILNASIILITTSICLVNINIGV